MKRSIPLKRKNPLRRVSAKRKREQVQYAKLKEEFLNRPENQYCPVMWELKREGQFTTEVHHKNGRAGSLYLDTRFWLAVSAEGHRIIHASPNLAREHGWLK